ncbi:MAG: hypothetical protein ACPGTR_04875 [Opitutales bacterium]
MKIITVLKTGGEFKERHVLALRDSCNKFAPGCEFVCLTDIELQCNTIQLEHGWPGWWSKMELFKLEGPILYIDLDTIITGDLSALVAKLIGEKFCILRDVCKGNVNHKAFIDEKKMGSGIMFWKSDMRFLYDDFLKKSVEYMAKFRGDQDYIESIMWDLDVTYLQDLTDSVVSFKIDLDHGRNYDPAIHRIVFFHGRPRPWEQSLIPCELYKIECGALRRFNIWRKNKFRR